MAFLCLLLVMALLFLCGVVALLLVVVANKRVGACGGSHFFRDSVLVAFAVVAMLADTSGGVRAMTIIPPYL